MKQLPSNQLLTNTPHSKRLYAGQPSVDQFQLNVETWFTFYSNLIEQYERELIQLPKGSLSCEHERGKQRFYYYKDGQRYYLSRKRDHELLSQLSRKRFIKNSLPTLQRNLKLLTSVQAKYWPYDTAAIAAPLSVSYPDFAKHFGLPEEKRSIDEWLAEPFTTNTGWPEQRIHRTARGEYVRSKSELVIANALYSHGIPYRYECLLLLGENSFFPDFYLLRPKDLRLCYWEHFGLLNDPQYTQRMDSKVRIYREHNIHQWDNLIVTYDTPEGALDMQKIETIISCMLL